MSAGIHDRALQLIAQERVEGISPAEREWLAAHCKIARPLCELARQTDQALRSCARGDSAPRGLASRTQFRVRLRAEECANMAWDENSYGHRRRFMGARNRECSLGMARVRVGGTPTGAPKLILGSGLRNWWAVPALRYGRGAGNLERPRR